MIKRGLFSCMTLIFCVVAVFGVPKRAEASFIQDYIIDPVSTLWRPWFDPNTSISYVVKEKEVPKEEEKEETPALIVTSTPTPQYSKSEIMSWIRDAIKLQSTVTYQSTEGQVAGASTEAPYERVATSQGLADTVGRTAQELQTNITAVQNNLNTITSGSLFDTSILTVDSVNSRVGIGTTSPTDTFSVNGPIFLANSSPSNTSNRLYANSGDLYWAGNLIGGSSTGVWGTNGTDVHRVTGNVGIGSTTPGYKLSVLGSGYFDGGTVTANIFTATSSISTPALTLSGASVNSLLSTNSSGTITPTSTITVNNIWATSTTLANYFAGNVGIGTTSPQSKLSVVANEVTDATISLSADDGDDASDTWFFNSVASNNALTLVNGAATAFSLTGSGALTLPLSGAQLTLYSSSDSTGLDIDIRASSLPTASYVYTADGSGGSYPFTTWGNLLLGPASGADVVLGRDSEMVIKDSGNVGIGTTGPGAKLDIGTAVAAGVPVEMIRNSYTGGGSFYNSVLSSFGGTAGQNGLYFKVTNNGGTGQTTPLQLTDTLNTITGTTTINGNVGIGTTDPQKKLQVTDNSGQTLIGAPSVSYGGIGFATTLTTSNASLFGNGTDNTTLNVASGGSLNLRISNDLGGQGGLTMSSGKLVYENGNVGIGTTGPLSKLDVRGNILLSSSNKLIFGGNGSALSSFQTISGDISQNDLTFRTYRDYFFETLTGDGTAGTNVLTIKTSGNVGIGTTAPSGKLHIVGGGTATTLTGSGEMGVFQNSASAGTGSNIAIMSGNTGEAQLLFGDTDHYYMGRVNYNNSDNSMALYTNNGERVRIQSDGNVGIGTTTPGAKLSIQSASSAGDGILVTAADNARIRLGEPTGAHWGQLSSTAYYTALSTAGNNHLAFSPGGTERVRIQPEGNVGIGTTSPSAKLSVKGGGTTTGRAFAISDSSDAEKFTVLDNGNVGIGTTSPSQKFVVEGVITAKDGGYTDLAKFSIDASSNLALLRNTRNVLAGTGSATNIYGESVSTYVSAGDVSVDLKANLGGQLKINQYFGDNDLAFYANGGSTKIMSVHSTASAGSLVVSSGSNIGIGTSTPWRKLSVNGTVAVPGLVNDSTGFYACVNTTTGELSTSTSACGASSIKFKENVEDLAYGLNEIIKLRPVSFDYKDSYIKDGRRQVGFIAEEVEPIIPEVVAYDNNGEVQGLDYPKFTSVIVKAIQEMWSKVGKIALWFKDDKFTVQGDVCVDDTCITKDQFKDMILRSGVGAVQIASPLQGEDTLTSGDTEAEVDANSAGDSAESGILVPGVVPEDVEQETGTTTEEIIEEVATTTEEIITEIPEEAASSTPAQ